MNQSATERQAPAPLPVTVIHVAAGRNDRGGERQVLLLAHRLQEWGQSQTVMTRDAGALARWLHEASLPVTPAAWDLSVDPRVILKLLRTIGGRPAIIHAHDPHALAVAAAVTAFVDVPLVVTRRVDNPLRRLGLWRRADRIIAISQRVAEVLAASGIPRDRITVVHSGIDPARTRDVVPHPVRAALGLPTDAPLAVSVGAMLAHKDHATLLRAAAVAANQRPDVHWVLAGDGPERPALEAQRTALGLDGRVHFVGHVPWAVGLIAAADVFVFSSREEGLGTSVLDAMALGVPVAATAGGGVPEMLGQGAGLLVPVADAPALASATLQLLQDAQLRAEVRTRATTQLARFTDRAMAAGSCAVYASVMRRTRA